MQTPRRCGYHRGTKSPLFATLCKEQNASPILSATCALFAKNTGVYPNYFLPRRLSPRGNYETGVTASEDPCHHPTVSEIFTSLLPYIFDSSCPALTLPLRNGMMVRFAYSRCAVPGLAGTGRRCDSGPGIRNRPSQRRAVCPHPSLATDGASEVASDIASKYRIGMAPRLPAARGSREGCS